MNRGLHTFRRRNFHCPGPNFTWHADGYDKLKPFEFAVHGCVDGYSRRVLWLKVSHTNNNPSVIASYFLETATSLRVCPALLQTDCGTENGSMAAIQTLLRQNDSDRHERQSHRYRSSISNQRRECWWSHFRRGPIAFLIRLFKDMVDEGNLDLHNTLHIRCIRFAFTHHVQRELDLAAQYWNTHRIRTNGLYTSEGGIPDEMYFIRNQTGALDCGRPVNMNSLAQCQEFVPGPSSVSGSEDFDDYMRQVMDQRQLEKCWNWEGCLRFYLFLNPSPVNRGRFGPNTSFACNNTG